MLEAVGGCGNEETGEKEYMYTREGDTIFLVWSWGKGRVLRVKMNEEKANPTRGGNRGLRFLFAAGVFNGLESNGDGWDE